MKLTWETCFENHNLSYAQIKMLVHYSIVNEYFWYYWTSDFKSIPLQMNRMCVEIIWKGIWTFCDAESAFELHTNLLNFETKIHNRYPTEFQWIHFGFHYTYRNLIIFWNHFSESCWIPTRYHFFWNDISNQKKPYLKQLKVKM